MSRWIVSVSVRADETAVRRAHKLLGETVQNLAGISGVTTVSVSVTREDETEDPQR